MRARDHHLWEEAGRPEGRAGQFWHRTERARPTMVRRK
ncbi:DUF2934 domain-containing protein [Bradyrhizobium sp. UFLA05-112]